MCPTSFFQLIRIFAFYKRNITFYDLSAFDQDVRNFAIIQKYKETSVTYFSSYYPLFFTVEQHERNIRY